jgi:hypothetical protein
MRVIARRRSDSITRMDPALCEPPRGEVISDHPHNGHADLGVTSAYLRGIDNAEIIHTVHERPAPMVRVRTGLTLMR